MLFPMRTWMRATSLLILLALVLGGARWAHPSDDPAAVVEMTNTLTFTPDTVEVAVGETVQWRNTSLLMHTVTADPEEATMDGSVRLPDGASPFDSGNLDPKQTFDHTFTTPGTYTYFCIPHEAAKMRGTVVVRPADG
jgi:plastocyanin